MSRETLSWLHAWHWRAEEHEDGTSNHYAGAIPLEDVQDRLFHWEAVSRRIAVELPSGLGTMTHWVDGRPMGWVPVEDRQAICRSDDSKGNVMGIFSSGYTRHQYREWLLNTVADLLDDDLAISSAGLLRGGAIAWVEVSMPETITTPAGVKFRPNLLATTSFDGSTATTYKRTVTDTICDNTRELALSEVGQEFRVKHSRNSRLQLAPARDALAMVHTMAEDFAAEVAQLCATPVSGAQWRQFLDEYVPRKDLKTGKPLEGRALTTAATKRERLDQLYRYDPRVSPWEGSAHGVLQAVNTYEHHEGVVRGDRSERNSLKTISGDFGQLDRKTWQTLQPLLLAA